MPFQNPDFTRSITIPTGATTGGRIVIGSNIPPELVAFGNIAGITFTSVILYYFTTTNYYWQGVGSILPNTPIEMSGTYDTVNGVYILQYVNPTAGAITQQIGSTYSTIQQQQDVVRVDLNIDNSSTLTIDAVTGDTFPRVCAAENDFSILSSVPGTYAGAGFALMSGSPSLALVRTYTDTWLRCMINATLYSTVANTQIELGVRISSPSFATQDFAICALQVNVANSHIQMSGLRSIKPVGAPAHATCTLQPIWRRAAGAGTLTVDGNDSLSFTAEEVTP